MSGTGTEVGKTYVAALIARAYRIVGRSVGVYKPVASGCSRENGELVSPDAVALWEAAGKPRTLEEVCPQRFEAALSPNQAAMEEGKELSVQAMIDGADVWKDFEVLLIEGAGGLMSPLTDAYLNADFVKRFEATHLVCVAANRLGIIHDVLATDAAAKATGLNVDWFVLNQTQKEADASIASNQAQIRRYFSGVITESVFEASEIRVPDALL